MSQSVVVYGIHAVTALLAHRPESVLELFVGAGDDDRLEELLALAGRAGVVAQGVRQSVLDRLCEGGVHQGVAARCRPRLPGDDHALWDYLVAQGERPLLILVLDQVQDPRNLGACLRCAEAAGAQAVVAPRRHSAPLTPAARKAAAGAAEIQPYFQLPNLARGLQTLQELGVRCVAVDSPRPGTPALYDLDLTGSVALVVGAEGRGLRRLTLERCDASATIPMPGTIPSLNVAVAAGIALFEALRQRRKGSVQV